MPQEPNNGRASRQVDLGGRRDLGLRKICRAPQALGALDTEFLTQEGDLSLRLLELCRRTGARIKASGGPSPRVDTDEPCQGDDAEQDGLDVAARIVCRRERANRFRLARRTCDS